MAKPEKPVREATEAQEETSPKGKQREFSPAVRLAVDKAAKATTLASRSQIAAEMIRDIQALTYDLELTSPLTDLKGIPTTGKKTVIIVAPVNQVLRFRHIRPVGYETRWHARASRRHG